MGKEKVREVLKLPTDMRTKMEGMERDIKKARHGVKVLREMGMDVVDIESKLDWAENVRTTMLKEFD